MKKVLALLLTGVLTASMAAGCSKPTASDSNTASPAKTTSDEKEDAAKEVVTTDSGYQKKDITDEPVTLRFMWWGGDERNSATLEVIDKFMALYPNVTIEAEYGGNEGYKEKLITQLYSGTAADMVQCDPAWFYELVENGDYLINHADYGDYFDISKFDDKLLNNYGVFDEKVLGVPTGTAGPALVLNTTLADKIGIDYKSQITWDSLIENGKKVQEYDKNMYFLNLDTRRVAEQIIRPMIMQKTGHPFIKNEEIAMSFTRDQLVEVLEYVKLLYDSKTVQPAQESAPFYNATETNPKWVAGEFVAGIGFASTANTLANAYVGEDANFVSIQVPLPEGRLNDGYLTAPPQMMATTASSKYPEVAEAFWDYFFNADESILTLKDLRSIPAIDYNRNLLTQNNMVTQLVTDAVNYAASLNGISEHGYTTGSEITQILIDMVESIAYSEADAGKVADESIELIQDFLAQQ
jgi:oligogalacturonide transport system substrate-binding protein